MELVDAIFGLIEFFQFIGWLFALVIKGLVALTGGVVSAGRAVRKHQAGRSKAGTRRCPFCGTRSFAFEIQVAGGCPGCGRGMVGWFLTRRGSGASEPSTSGQASGGQGEPTPS